MFTRFFNAEPVFNYAAAARSDVKKYARYFNALLDNGIYCAPSQFEANFVSFSHSNADIAATLKIIEKILTR